MKKIVYFSLTAMLILAVTLSSYGGGKVTGAEINHYFAYVANNNSVYVSAYSINPATGDLTEITGVVAKSASDARAITADPSGRFVYTANLYSNNISAFSVNPATGKLTEITGSPFAAGTYPSSITTDPSGKFAYVTNEGSNTVSAYSVNAATGALTKVNDSPASSWPRSITVDPTGKFAYVANYDSNNISAYSINAATGALTKLTGSPFAAGQHPNSIKAEPSGRFVYAANRISKSISAYSINPATGALTKLTGSPFAASTFLDKLTVDPSGKFVYVTTDGNNVAGYSINQATGALTKISSSPFITGASPYGMAFDPSGRYFYVANYSSKTISALTFNPVTGILTPNPACAFAAASPVDIVTVKTIDPSSQPNLVVTSAAVTSRTVISIPTGATQVTYSYTIKNTGGVTIPSLYNVAIQNFYSANTIFNDTGDVAAGSGILAVDRPLAPGESYSGTFATTSAVPAGMNYLTFKIDSGNIIAESDENNNTFALSLLPDLVITNAAITSRTATQINYSYTIKNIGNDRIPSLFNLFIQNLYSADPTFGGAGDITAGAGILAVDRPLAAGESYSGTFSASGAVPAGMNYLTFQIGSGSIAESDQTNNTFALSLLPDLVISSVVITSETDTGLNYAYTIKNIGNEPFPSQQDVQILSYYSANTIPGDSDDVYAYGFMIRLDQPLASGESYSGTFWTSGAAPAGMNYLTFKMYPSIAELDQNNNTFAVSLLPDLVFTNVTVTYRTDTQVYYAYTIKNVGGSTIPSLYNVCIQNFFSADTIFNYMEDEAAGGSILGVDQPLGPGESYSGTYLVYGPAPSGMLYITGQIDWGNFVKESDESNNFFALLIP